MGWRGRGRGGQWPGRGPFSYLPPWQRPGWLYGRGACWWLAPKTGSTASGSTAVSSTVSTAPLIPTLSKEQEKEALEQQTKLLQSQLDAIKKRIDELN